MERAEIEKEIEFIFQEAFEDSTIKLKYETNADDIDEWDSLMQISLLIMIEKKFKIRLNPLKIVDLENVGQMIDMLEKLCQK